MKQFSTGTKGRKQAHAAACKEIINQIAANANNAQLAIEYIKEVSPFGEVDDWAKWTHPSEAALEFKQWMGQDLAPVTQSPVPAQITVPTEIPKQTTNVLTKSPNVVVNLKEIQLEEKLKIAGSIISKFLEKKPLDDNDLKQLEILAKYIPFLTS